MSPFRATKTRKGGDGPKQLILKCRALDQPGKHSQQEEIEDKDIFIYSNVTDHKKGGQRVSLFFSQMR